jgi:hypothetical protein
MTLAAQAKNLSLITDDIVVRVSRYIHCFAPACAGRSASLAECPAKAKRQATQANHRPALIMHKN